MKTPAAIFIASLIWAAAWWWEFLCARVLGALIQLICNLGFMP